MQRTFSSPSSLSPISGNTLNIGGISVTVPAIGDLGLAPSGISPRDPASAMVDTRSSDARKLEEMLTAAIADLRTKLTDADRRREDFDKSRDRADEARDRQFKELRDEFIALQVQQNELMTRMLAPGGGGAPYGGGAPIGGPTRAPYFATRQLKVGFPIFLGEDLAGWILRCDHFFTVDLTPEEAKVRLAVINFEGRALQWFQNWSKYQDLPMATPWPLFLQALEGRFGDHLLGDPMTELLSLKQTGSFSDYHDKFELLLGRVSLSESYAISHFINGLRPNVQRAVRLFMPQTLVHAYALARLQEMSNIREGFTTNTPRKFEPKYSPLPTASSGNPPLLPTPITPAFKNRRILTEEQMAECRAKGTCYGCNEKFERGHRCARKQLYIMEIDDTLAEQNVVNEVEDKEEELVAEDENPLISIHAINGSVS